MDRRILYEVTGIKMDGDDFETSSGSDEGGTLIASPKSDKNSVGSPGGI